MVTIRSDGTRPYGQDAATRDPLGSDRLGMSRLDRLLTRVSPLDRLVADAGPLGKFRTDQPDALPAGTSAFTVRVNDTLNRLAARLGLPAERILSGNPGTAQARPIEQARTELPPGAQATAADRGTRIADPRPAVGTETDNRTRTLIAGNPPASGA